VDYDYLTNEVFAKKPIGNPDGIRMARGKAWERVIRYTLMYRETKDKKYLVS